MYGEVIITSCFMEVLQFLGTTPEPHPVTKTHFLITFHFKGLKSDQTKFEVDQAKSVV